MISIDIICMELTICHNITHILTSKIQQVFC